eukprot:1809187-Prymnesium_polylepis.1
MPQMRPSSWLMDPAGLQVRLQEWHSSCRGSRALVTLAYALGRQQKPSRAPAPSESGVRMPAASRPHHRGSSVLVPRRTTPLGR